MTDPQHPTPFVDVRMRGFGERASVAAVLQLLDARTQPLSAEVIPVVHAAGRVLASPVVALASVPGFVRAAMDGFAVRSSDTAGAGPANPVALTLVGESLPARPFAGEVGAGQAVRVMTGAPVPAGADAIVVVERARQTDDGHVLAHESVPEGKHIGAVGEDVPEGRTVLPAGRKLRPQDVGIVASVGVGAVSVVRRPRVAILVTGDELLPPGSVPGGYRIVDSNSPMLTALATRDGADCGPVRYLPDRYEDVRDALRQTSADVILVSGGTSVGAEDHTPQAVAELGELAVHGVAMRPAGPLGVGFLPPRDGHAPVVFLLPGNPVSCLCGYDVFAGRAVRRLGGRSPDLPYRRLRLPLVARVVSAVGRVDYLRVRVTERGVEPIAVSGASVLSTTVTADGFVVVEADRGELAEGESVDVWLYD